MQRPTHTHLSKALKERLCQGGSRRCPGHHSGRELLRIAHEHQAATWGQQLQRDEHAGLQRLGVEQNRGWAEQ